MDATPPRSDPAPGLRKAQGVADASVSVDGAGGGVRAELRVGARQGLHARPAARLVETAKRFQAEIRIQHGASAGSAKDLLDVLYLAAPQGAVLLVEARGPDAVEAVEALVRLLELLAGEDGP